MTAHSAAETSPSLTIPENREAMPAARHLRAVPDWRPSAAAPGPSVPAEAVASRVSSTARRSFAPASAGRALRPLQTGGAPPTVIRDLDALFAADRRRRSTPPPAPRPAPSVVRPMDPRDLAQALLAKVERDFGTIAPPRPAAPPPVARFVVTTPTQRDEATQFLALPADDEDVVRLTPWYVRWYRALFG